MQISARLFLLAGLCLAVQACDDGGEKDSAEDPGGGGGGGGPNDTQDSGAGDTGGPPSDPTPFQIVITGALEETLSFDQPTCTQQVGSNNFSMIWRDESRSHYFFLAASLLGDLDGTGTYDYSNSSPTFKLQEEAGGQNRYFYVDTAQGDDGSLTLDYLDEEKAWGEFSFTGMHGSTGAITGDPMPVPIWCPSLN